MGKNENAELFTNQPISGALGEKENPFKHTVKPSASDYLGDGVEPYTKPDTNSIKKDADNKPNFLLLVRLLLW